MDQIEMTSLDDLVPEDHLVRKLENAIDWSFIYEMVEDSYSPIKRRLFIGEAPLDAEHSKPPGRKARRLLYVVLNIFTVSCAYKLTKKKEFGKIQFAVCLNRFPDKSIRSLSGKAALRAARSGAFYRNSLYYIHGEAFC